MEKNSTYFFVGTTAEYIKLAAIIRELKKRKIPFKLITSGQNRINFKDYESFTGKVTPHHQMRPKPKKSSIFFFFAWAIRTVFLGLWFFRKEFKGNNKRQTFFIVHGDTVTSLIGALIAKLLGVKLVHVESGLRSFSFLEPIPEEIIRYIIIQFADILFAPTDWAKDNLKGLKGEKISTKENTLIESDLWALKSKQGLEYTKRFGKYYVLIIHRQEHVFFKKNWARDNIEFIIENANKDLNCVFVMFSLTSRYLQSERINEIKAAREKLFIVPKLPFKTFITLMDNAEFIATDSCTNQEEAHYLGLPILSLRNRTERVEGLGENVVIAKDNKKTIKSFLKNYNKYRKPKPKVKIRPSKIIVDYLINQK